MQYHFDIIETLATLHCKYQFIVITFDNEKYTLK